MFREMRRFKQEISLERAEEVLLKGKRAVLSLNGDDGYPYGVPIDYIFIKEENAIYFHGAKEGHKADAIRRNDKVSFTVIGDNEYSGGDWAPYVDSVIVFGRCSIVVDKEISEDRLRALGIKYYPTVESVDESLKNSNNRPLMFKISIENIKGKHVHEK